MPPENPYAAPQTLELRTNGALPVAEVSGRNLFPELSTAQLTRLADYSHTMKLMSSLWVIPLVICCLLCASFQEFSSKVQITFFLLVPLLGMRVVGGHVRGSSWRYYTALFDGLSVFCLPLAALAGFLTLPSGNLTMLILYVPLCCAIVFIEVVCFTSFLAHRCAPELFGPRRYVHRELAQEADHRRQHGIA